MKANETYLRQIIEGNKQYIVPLFQRSYSWELKNWEHLWNDVYDLYQQESPTTHFLGAAVFIQSPYAQQEEISSFLIIDGQQRIFSLFVFLIALRDRCQEIKEKQLAEEIHEMYIINKYRSHQAKYKFLPSESDKTTFFAFVENNPLPVKNKLYEFYAFLKKKLQKENLHLRKIKNILLQHLSLVAIYLEPDENPYIVFESLNNKGQALLPTDLIRNHVFMIIDSSQQQNLYTTYWFPMQEKLGKYFHDFFHRYITLKKARYLKKENLFFEIKNTVHAHNVFDFLQEINYYGNLYAQIIDPSTFPIPKIQNILIELKSCSTDIIHPVLLFFLSLFQQQQLNIDELESILIAFRNYVVRHYIVRKGTQGLNAYLPLLIQKFNLSLNKGNTPAEEILQHLRSKTYDDDEFRKALLQFDFYENKNKKITQYILLAMENALGNKEKIQDQNLTIEHVMPQKLSEWWQNHLQQEMENTHKLYLNNIGNLTLTAYNAELSNLSFPEKKRIYAQSKLFMNQYFLNIEQWKKEDIEKRALLLAEKAIQIWSANTTQENVTLEKDVEYSKPYEFFIGNQTYHVNSWQDVLKYALDFYYKQNENLFFDFASQNRNLLNLTPDSFRAPKKLNDSFYYESNLPSTYIYKICERLADFFHFNEKQWSILYR